MSLYLKERIDEQQKEDPLKDIITFTHQWVIRIPPANENNGQNQDIKFRKRFGTCYKFGNEIWNMKLRRNEIRIGTYNAFDDEPKKIWNGSCFLSYNLYYDNDTRFLLYSSLRIRMTEISNADMFLTPNGFMTRMVEAFEKRKIAKIVIFVELHLPLKHFDRPFCMPSCYLNIDLYEDYPNDMNNHPSFIFLNNGDLSIKCLDGSMCAVKVYLKQFCNYVEKNCETSNDNELIVEHSIDVVKPIIVYLHTHCFKMPKVYALDYAMRLFIAIDFFEIKCEALVKAVVEKELCKKFIEEPHNFNSILQWASVASRHSLLYLEIMISTVIAKKYYFKWQDTFPENARNVENLLFLDIFGSENAAIFARIDEIFEESFLTKVILD